MNDSDLLPIAQVPGESFRTQNVSNHTSTFLNSNTALSTSTVGYFKHTGLNAFLLSQKENLVNQFLRNETAKVSEVSVKSQLLDSDAKRKLSRKQESILEESPILDRELRKCIQSLEKEIDKKTEDDYQKVLIPLLRNITFFQKEEIDISEEDLYFIAERLKFEFLGESDYVMNYGERGDKFYILIKGAVEILVPERKLDAYEEKQLQKQKLLRKRDLQNAFLKIKQIVMESQSSVQSKDNLDGVLNSQDSFDFSSTHSYGEIEVDPNLDTNFFELVFRWQDAIRSLQLDLFEGKGVIRFKVATKDTFYGRRTDEIILIEGFFYYLCKKFPEVKNLNSEVALSRLPIYTKQQQEDILFSILLDQVQLSSMENGKLGEYGAEFSQMMQGPTANKKAARRLSRIVQPSVMMRDSVVSGGDPSSRESKQRQSEFVQMTHRFREAQSRIVNYRQDSNFKKVGTLTKKGDSFGEQALLNSKPRAATVKCATPCFFAVMNRQDYEKSLGKIQKKQMNKMIEFLRGCPHFRHWSRTALVKLTYYFKKKQYRRNNIIYAKGDPTRNIYIVLNGEFEQIKHIKVQKKRDETAEVTKLFMHGAKSERHEDMSRLKNAKSLKQNTERFNLQCSIICKGQIFGEEDAIHSNKHSKTVKCKSFKGELLEMSISDFYYRVKAVSEESWKQICENSAFKVRQLKMSTRISKQMRLRKHDIVLDREGSNLSPVNNSIDLKEKVRSTLDSPNRLSQERSSVDDKLSRIHDSLKHTVFSQKTSQRRNRYLSNRPTQNDSTSGDQMSLFQQVNNTTENEQRTLLESQNKYSFNNWQIASIKCSEESKDFLIGNKPSILQQSINNESLEIRTQSDHNKDGSISVHDNVNRSALSAIKADIFGGLPHHGMSIQIGGDNIRNESADEERHAPQATERISYTQGKAFPDQELNYNFFERRLRMRSKKLNRTQRAQIAVRASRGDGMLTDRTKNVSNPSQERGNSTDREGQSTNISMTLQQFQSRMVTLQNPKMFSNVSNEHPFQQIPPGTAKVSLDQASSKHGGSRLQWYNSRMDTLSTHSRANNFELFRIDHPVRNSPQGDYGQFDLRGSFAANHNIITSPLGRNQVNPLQGMQHTVLPQTSRQNQGLLDTVRSLNTPFGIGSNKKKYLIKQQSLFKQVSPKRLVALTNYEGTGQSTRCVYNSRTSPPLVKKSKLW